MYKINFQLYKALRPSFSFSRGISKLVVSEEVREAVASQIPVVALESTIITHGLPYPANIEMARSVEALIRANGAIPATIAFVDGVPKVGLDEKDLAILADHKNDRKYKISRRDVAYIMANGLTGGTTIASTMMLAHKANIDVFATGGLGGVSRPFELMDVSADLDELSKTPVAVVCSGPKSILDVRRTMEYLETKGVPVATYLDQSNPAGEQINVPGFYTRDSGVRSPFSFDDYATAAKMVYSGKDIMSMENGYLFCIPPPVDVALPAELINNIIEETQIEADKLKVFGKDLTPFMLGRINQRTNGISVKCNVDFVKNNAITGAKIAKELSYLRRGETRTSFQPAPINLSEATKKQKSSSTGPVSTAIVGSIALDSTSIIISSTPSLGDSNPSKTHQSPGGVGFNVALACNASSASSSHTLFISAVNSNDIAGQTLLQTLRDHGLSTDGIFNITESGVNTAQYTSIHDSNGDLIISCADMSIVEKIPSDHVIDILRRMEPKYVLVDSNVSVKLLNNILGESVKTGFKVVYEPTSIVKANKLSQTELDCFPNNSVELMTPTISELNTIFESFEKSDRFNPQDPWFAVLDMLQIGSEMRNKLEVLGRKFPLIEKYMSQGILTQCFMLLPYIPKIIVKDGANGILVIQLSTTAKSDKGLIDSRTFQFKAPHSSQSNFSILQEGRHDFGCIIQHFSSLEIATDEIKSVTGAGDSFVGHLMSRISAHNEDVLSDIGSSEREAILLDSLKCARLSLQSSSAVDTDGIRRLGV